MCDRISNHAGSDVPVGFAGAIGNAILQSELRGSQSHLTDGASGDDTMRNAKTGLVWKRTEPHEQVPPRRLHRFRNSTKQPTDSIVILLIVYRASQMTEVRILERGRSVDGRSTVPLHPRANVFSIE